MITTTPVAHRTLRSGTVWMLLLIAVLLRAGAVLAVGRVAQLHGDEEYYVSAATALVRGQGYPGSVRPPGFPFFISLVFRLCGESLTAVRLFQIPAGVLIVFLVFDMVRRRYGDRAAFVSGLLCAVNPTLVHYTHFLWSEILFTALLVLTIWLLDRFDHAPRPVYLVTAGAALAVSALTREIGLYLLPLVLVWLWLAPGTPARDRLRFVFLMAAVVVLSIAPWTLRNWNRHHHFVLISTTRWFPMAVGNMLDSEGWATSVERRNDFRERYYQIQDEIEREGLARQVALREIAARQPWWLVKKAVINTHELFTTYDQLSRFLRAGWIDRGAVPVAGTLVVGEVGFYVSQLAVGLVALCLVPGGRLKKLIVSAMALFLAIYLIANASHRFRVPFLPWFALYSGPLLCGGWNRDRWSRWRASGAGFLIVTLVAIVVADVRSRGRVPRDVGGESARRNLVLVSIDALRADHLSCYGYRRFTSPTIDGLAAHGVLFEHAYSPSSWTLPAHASMLSGVSPFQHGATDSKHRIREDVALVAQRLGARGYLTGAVVNGPFLGKEYGFARGFDHFVELHKDRTDREAYQSMVVSTLRGLKRESAGRPVFLFVHYMNVHSPYAPPPGYDRFVSRSGSRLKVTGENMGELARKIERGDLKLSEADVERLVGLYDGEILAMDDQLKEFLGVVRRQLPGPTLLIVTADHGEEFLEHGRLIHGRTLYDEVLHVPLILIGPDLPAGKRVHETVSLLDIVPTLIEWAAGPLLVAPQNRSLLGRIAGERTMREEPLLLLTWAHDGSVRRRGLRSSTEKLILDEISGRGEYYSLANDPGERWNRYPAKEARSREEALRRLVVHESGRRPALDARETETLEALGYVE